MTSKIQPLHYETSRYFTQSGPSTVITENQAPCYQLVNRSTGLIEFETFALPQLLEVMVGYESSLLAAEKVIEENTIEVPGEDSSVTH